MLQSSMVYREELPSCTALDAVWTVAIKHDLRTSLPYRTLPDGCVDLLYRVRRDRAGKVDAAALLVADPTDAPATFFPSAGEEFIGVRLAPGWGGFALGVSPVELRETVTDVQALTVRLSRLQESLFACHSHRQAAVLLRDTVETWTHTSTRKRPILQALRMLRMCGGTMRGEDAARHLGISSRTFRRDVKELSGLTPKALTRIFRFRRALERLNEGKGISLCDVALASGYADQAHMTRQFKRLGGFTPALPVMLARNAPLPEET